MISVNRVLGLRFRFWVLSERAINDIFAGLESCRQEEPIGFPLAGLVEMRGLQCRLCNRLAMFSLLKPSCAPGHCRVLSTRCRCLALPCSDWHPHTCSWCPGGVDLKSCGSGPDHSRGHHAGR